MLSTRVVFLMILFALAAVGAFAQSCPPAVTSTAPGCPTITTPAAAEPTGPAVGAGPAVAPAPVCPPVAAQAPVCPPMGAGPAVTPAPVAEAQPVCPPAIVCPEAVVTAQAPSCAIAAGFGGGPHPVLVDTPAGPDFDRVYMENMYQMRAALTALTTQGIQQSTDRNLRDLSGTIRTEQTDQNRKLAMWYRDMGLGTLQADYCEVGGLINCIAAVQPGDNFNVVYAQTLADSLTALRNSALVGAPKLTSDEIRHQAELTARVAQNEIDALHRWLADRGYTPGMASPGAFGAGAAYHGTGTTH